jgi:hypothetical protein
MDLQSELSSRVSRLPDGDFMPGLRAVLAHLTAALAHFDRGRSTQDDTAFTDAIYRTNQVFEGSLKEAFRVLTGNDPQRSTPAQIENHLVTQSVLRPRVVDQLTNYRQHWRNPSTHDHRLDFDEDEALLAIASVSVFAIVLVDQIAERLFQQRVAAQAPPSPLPDSGQPLFKRTADALKSLADLLRSFQEGEPGYRPRENEIVAGLHLLLPQLIPEAKVELDPLLSPEHDERADLLVTSGDSHVIVEIKRGNPTKQAVEQGLQQLHHYQALSGILDAALFIYSPDLLGPTTVSELPSPVKEGRTVVVSTGVLQTSVS